MYDKVQALIKGGEGGNGAISFRREKFVPLGGPDGGDGGDGGSVYIVADGHITDFGSFKGKRQWQGEKGGQGEGNKRRGKKGEDVEVKVPPGTTVFRREDSEESLVADLVTEGQRILVARGGKGGWGNARFATPTHRVPQRANPGEPGEEVSLTLTLRLCCDVGIVGMPNSGKSTLLCSITGAHPEVAEYPFTTREPVPAVLEAGYRHILLVELPALVAGAHQGQGRGNSFLCHLERARLVLLLLDGSAANPRRELETLLGELASYSLELARKPQVVAVNKIDLPAVRPLLPKLMAELALLNLPVFFISASTGEGVKEMVEGLAEKLDSLPAEEPQAPTVVFRPRPVSPPKGRS